MRWRIIMSKTLEAMFLDIALAMNGFIELQKIYLNLKEKVSI